MSQQTLSPSCLPVQQGTSRRRRRKVRLPAAAAAAIVAAVTVLSECASMTDAMAATVVVNAPPVAMAATPDSNGYWEVASDGGVFAFGDAGFYGSMGGQHLNAPVVGITATPDGKGYWEVASDGGIFAFGDAGFYGSMGGQHLNAPVVGIAGSHDGAGYWEVASDGGIFAFGDAAYDGSVQYTPPANAALYAKQILANKNVTENGRDVVQDLQAAAAGRKGSSGAFLSATLLSLVAELGRYHTVTITALESGGTGHAANSLHYSGDAVDLGRLDGAGITGRNAPSITIIKELDWLMPAGSAFGQAQCGATPPLPPGISTFNDTCNHLHIQVPRGTP